MHKSKPKTRQRVDDIPSARFAFPCRRRRFQGEIKNSVVYVNFSPCLHFEVFEVNTTQLLMNHVEMYVDLVRVEEQRRANHAGAESDVGEARGSR
jgi:hypothetical protein